MKKIRLRYHLSFEIFIWIFYVLMYKYAHYVDTGFVKANPEMLFPKPELAVFAVVSSVIFIPYYRVLIPRLLGQRYYWRVFFVTLLWFFPFWILNRQLCFWIFSQLNFWPESKRLFDFYLHRPGFDFNLLCTDALAFLLLAFSRYSYENEKLRTDIEKDNLDLQLTMLKSQLKPHFLLNNLNSLYGTSLTRPQQAPEQILLLSRMMQYILYDCEKQNVGIQQETEFLQTFFELEQLKFPNANIHFDYQLMDQSIQIPPLLALPLVENSFGFGLHRVDDHAFVKASLKVDQQEIRFIIENQCIPGTKHQVSDQHSVSITNKERGGIGLANLKKRLQLYFPERHTLKLEKDMDIFKATLLIRL